MGRWSSRREDFARNSIPQGAPPLFVPRGACIRRWKIFQLSSLAVDLDKKNLQQKNWSCSNLILFLRHRFIPFNKWPKRAFPSFLHPSTSQLPGELFFSWFSCEIRWNSAGVLFVPTYGEFVCFRDTGKKFNDNVLSTSFENTYTR